MRAPIDKAGRLAIPKELRDEVGLRLVIPAGGAAIDDDLVRSLRDAGQP
jgi:DNA-binding transcriptional regulator/RsmH inhibitor MraZ